MKKLMLFVCLLTNVAFAQQDAKATFKNNVFLELLGNGGYASFNYERIIFSHKKITIFPSIGISTFKTKDFTGTVNPDVIIPLGLRMYYGSRHMFVFGLGQTISSTVYLNPEDFEAKRSYKLSANVMLGYRINFKRINLQLAYTPIFENYNHYINWLGFSVGYKF
ncbi:hypothetical protein F0919_10355 [Taibaiella lutea]|uniref:Outer membrane protein beta-barrel domain-containing protein n=1 Tax=Taibaiella lutea TaxID=2608001 RepID=A0A5M6CKN9_9BACT|nr:hypothetical protein [Taibaiella lutea]KAA5534990.1 hypothetical protein F0919_10355 [Taibaiella lutea]